MTMPLSPLFDDDDGLADTLPDIKLTREPPLPPPPSLEVEKPPAVAPEGEPG